MASFVSNNLLMRKDARMILAENLSALMAKSANARSQNALSRATRGNVGQTTIGNILNLRNKTTSLESIEYLADAFHVSVGELLSDNLGKPETAHRSAPTPARADPDLTDTTRQVMDRLRLLESAGLASPELWQAVESVITLAMGRSTVAHVLERDTAALTSTGDFVAQLQTNTPQEKAAD